MSAGFKKGDDNVFNGYKYLGNAFEIFEDFSKDNLPFKSLYDSEGKLLHGSLFGSAFGGMKYSKQFESKVLPGPTQISLPCTVKELYNGCLKRLEYE